MELTYLKGQSDAFATCGQRAQASKRIMAIDPPSNSTSATQRRLLIAVRLAVIVGLVLLANYGFDWLKTRLDLLDQNTATRAKTGLIVTVLIGYALLIAVPFMPGVEIGVALLMIQGAAAAPLVYLATFTGMMTAFLIGHTLPLNLLISFCDDLRLRRISTLLTRINETPSETRLVALQERLPNWLARLVTGYRYVIIGVLVNTPGNIALGGGGGIMLLSGLGRIFQTGWMALTIALATLPVPLTVWLMGTQVLK